MTIQQALQKQPNLRLVNINNVSSRLAARTNGTCFIAFNVLHQTYELHCTLSFKESHNTCNAVIDEGWLNWRIIEDYLANNHRKNAQELQDNREYMASYYEKADAQREFALTSGRLNIIKRTLGRTT